MRRARILVVDDVRANVRILKAILESAGYEVVPAASGKEAIQKVYTSNVDLVLLAVMMPDMSGYEICKTLRATPMTEILPVVMVTELDAAEERMQGLEVGADDFLNKPINTTELLARVRSLLRIKRLQDEVKIWNYELENRVKEQTRHLERLGRLKNFFAPEVAERILSSGEESVLRPHRREVTVMFMDLRGFTAFTETADPEEVMAVLGEYHAAVGRLVMEHEGTLERFAGDGIMIFFNDPVLVADPAPRAVRMAQAMQCEVERLSVGWRKRGYELQMGVGIAQGFATIGGIGFPGRIDYGAIGNVTNLAARLCGEAHGGEILVSQRVCGLLDGQIAVEPRGELVLKGFQRPVPAFRVAAAAG